MKAWPGIPLIALIAVPRLFAGPEQEAVAAIADLRAQENYSWTRELDDASRRIRSPGGGSAGRGKSGSSKAPDVSGRTKNGGLTEWLARPDMHPDRVILGANRDDRLVINPGDGWWTLRELGLLRRAGDRELRTDAKGRTDGAPAREHHFLTEVEFVARLGHLTPVVMLQAIEGEMQEFSSAAGVISANLTERGAQQVLELVKGSHLVSSLGVDARATLGKVTLSVRQGRLVKLEVLIEGDLAVAPMSRSPVATALSQNYTFTFDKFGTSNPQVPDEALEKLTAAGSE